jgi:GMP synthase-like glutamine amidotransferase
MSFGGAMHLDQVGEHPWLGAERELVARLLNAEVPLLGACLGAQILCTAAGGEVRRMPAPEIGWSEVEVLPEAAGDPVIAPAAPSLTAFNWHSYECVPPPGSAVLARTPACVQAFRIGRSAWGLQFHAEVTRRDANHWFDDWSKDEDAVDSGLDPEVLRAEMNAAIEDWNTAGRGLCKRFLAAVEANAG